MQHSKLGHVNIAEIKLDTTQDLEKVIQLLDPAGDQNSAFDPVLSTHLDQCLLNRFDKASEELVAENSRLKVRWSFGRVWSLTFALLACFFASGAYWLYFTNLEGVFETSQNELQVSTNTSGLFNPSRNPIIIPATTTALPVATIETCCHNLITSIYPSLTTYLSPVWVPVKESFYNRYYNRLTLALSMLLKSRVEIDRINDEKLKMHAASERCIMPQSLISDEFESPCWPLPRQRPGRLAFNLTPGSKVRSVLVDVDAVDYMVHRMAVYGQVDSLPKIKIDSGRPALPDLSPDWIFIGTAQRWGNGSNIVTIGRDTELAKLEFKRILIDFPAERDAMQCISKVRVTGVVNA